MGKDIKEAPKLKMYHLNPNSYGSEWFTIAENKEQAIKNILELSKKELAETTHFNSNEKDTVRMIKKIKPSDESTFPRGYTLDEYENGTAIRSEIA